MTLPLWTTTIEVLRKPAGDDVLDSWEQPPTDDYAAVSSGVRAHIGVPSGREVINGTTQEEVQFRLVSDSCDLRHTDHVVDLGSGTRYEVVWAIPRAGLGVLDHTAAGLRLVVGAPS